MKTQQQAKAKGMASKEQRLAEAMRKIAAPDRLDLIGESARGLAWFVSGTQDKPWERRVGCRQSQESLKQIAASASELIKSLHEMALEGTVALVTASYARGDNAALNDKEFDSSLDQNQILELCKGEMEGRAPLDDWGLNWIAIAVRDIPHMNKPFLDNLGRLVRTSEKAVQLLDGWDSKPDGPIKRRAALVSLVVSDVYERLTGGPATRWGRRRSPFEVFLDEVFEIFGIKAKAGGQVRKLSSRNQS